MFRSVFTKYITVFMLIIIISFIIQISIISTLIGGYSDTSREVSLTTAADAVASYFQSGTASTRFNTIEKYINSFTMTIQRNIYMMFAYKGDLSVIITDYDGKIIFSMGDGVPTYPNSNNDYTVDDDGGVYVSEEIIKNVREKSYMFTPEEADGNFSHAKYIYGRAVVNKNQDMSCIVFACSSDSGMDELLESLINTSIMSSLWIMLAALIAVYFISERIISPLKNMSLAAKSYSAGNFDVRVPVVGNDEVTELAIAFNNMANSLSNFEEMRSSFLANVSHDLRTPMTTISGFIDSIIDGAIPEDQHKHYLGVISSEVKRLSRLVNSLLDISKIQAGERKFNRTNFDICEMARQILISMEKRIEQKNLDVEFDVQNDNMYVNADHDAIYQILYNICDNAVKFACVNGKYKIGIKNYGKKIHVSVYNEGEGLAKEDLPFVFERFYKSDKSRGLDKTGAGLGLYIAKTIVDAHGEKIEVDSEHGKYCQFTFTLEPAQTPHA